jgi:VanZ family protein
VAVTPNKLMRLVNLWLPVAAVMAVIFRASSFPGRDIPSLFPFQDVCFHGSIYALLGFFLARALQKTYSQAGFWKCVLLVTACGIAYGLTDEFHQRFVPGRSADFFDVSVDGIGTFIGSVVYIWFT